MNSLGLLLFVAALANAKPGGPVIGQPDGRIIGGEEAPPRKYLLDLLSFIIPA